MRNCGGGSQELKSEGRNFHSRVYLAKSSQQTSCGTLNGKSVLQITHIHTKKLFILPPPLKANKEEDSKKFSKSFSSFVPQTATFLRESSEFSKRKENLTDGNFSCSLHKWNLRFFFA